MFSKTGKTNAFFFGIAALFCLTLMAGCAPQLTTAGNPSSTVVVSPISNVSPAATNTKGLVSLETEQPLTSTIPTIPTLNPSIMETITKGPVATETESPTTPAPTPEPLGEFEAAAICIPVEAQIPRGFALNGGLFLYDLSRGRQSNAVSMNLSNGSISEFAPIGYRVIMLRISPDGTQAAYIVINRNDYSDRRLFIRNFVTNATIDLPWKPDWDLSGLRQWLNSQELLIRLQSYEYPYPLIAFNPFTRESAVLPITFPNQEIPPPGINVSPTEYDPSLNYAVYPAKQEGVNGFFLFDRSANAQVAFFPSLIMVESGSPAWSHDGQKFVFASKMIDSDSSINVGRPDGSVTPIVNLSHIMGHFALRSFTWSPDDKFVAVNIYDIDQEMDKLLLLDLDEQKVLDHCIKIEYDPWLGNYSDSNFPTWSPDSRYLIVEEQFDEGKNKVILIDVTQMRAGIMAQDQMILGWVALAP